MSDDISVHFRNQGKTQSLRRAQRFDYQVFCLLAVRMIRKSGYMNSAD